MAIKNQWKTRFKKLGEKNSFEIFDQIKKINNIMETIDQFHHLHKIIEKFLHIAFW